MHGQPAMGSRRNWPQELNHKIHDCQGIPCALPGWPFPIITVHTAPQWPVLSCKVVQSWCQPTEQPVLNCKVARYQDQHENELVHVTYDKKISALWQVALTAPFGYRQSTSMLRRTGTEPSNRFCHWPPRAGFCVSTVQISAAVVEDRAYQGDKRGVLMERD